MYIACSMDGFIAGEGGDLSWLPHPEPDEEDTRSAPTNGVSFEEFAGECGVILMGRATYDAVKGMEVPAWPYPFPTLVATHRELEGLNPGEDISAVSGDIGSMIAQAREVAGGKDVYLDGGAMIRQALDAGLVDELIVSMAPIVLGKGSPLFAGVDQRHTFETVSIGPFGGQGMIQWTLRSTASKGEA